MMSNRVVLCWSAIALLIVLPIVWAPGSESTFGEQPSSNSSSIAVEHSSASRDLARPDLTLQREASEAGLRPRTPMPRRPDAELRMIEGLDSDRLIVKFKDGVRARTSRTPAQTVQSQNAIGEINQFNEIVQQFGLAARQALNLDPARLQELQENAAKRSGRAQPDLAGIIYVEGPAEHLEQAARIINQLPIVEYAEFEGILDPVRMTNRDVADLAAKNFVELHKPEAEDPIVDLGPSPTGYDRPRQSPSYEVQLGIESGPRSAGSRGSSAPSNDEFQEVFSEVVGEEGAPWVRVHFRDVKLRGSVERGTGAYIKVTSLHNGDSQVLNARELTRWRNSTGIFRGGAVHVALYVKPNTGTSQLTIDRVTIGEWVGGEGLFEFSVCDDEDNREIVFNTDEGEQCIGQGTACATGRLWPNVCTGFVFRDNGLFQDNKFWVMTAGSCMLNGAPEVVQFNVPISFPDGTPDHPPLASQFPVEPIVLFNKDHIMDPCGPGTCSRDWGLLKIEGEGNDPNPVDTFGLSNADIYQLVDTPPVVNGQEIRVRGYGNTVQTPLPLEWNLVLKDSVGPLMFSDFFAGVHSIGYRADATFGDTGAPVTLQEGGMPTNQVVAIHACGGCLAVGGMNFGTSVTLPDLQHGLTAAFNEDVEHPNYFNNGACCIQGTCFNALTEEECDDNNGFFAGIGTECGVWGCSTIGCCVGPIGTDDVSCITTDEWGCRAVCGTVLEFDFCDPDDPPVPCDEEPDCGVPTAGSCYFPNFTLGCAEETCCAAICQIDPDCCEEPGEGQWRFGGWDEICAFHARRLAATLTEGPVLVCGGGGAVGPLSTEHPCFQTVGDCYSENTTVGCDDPGCCLSVCMEDPLCCEPPFRWDAVCVELAEQLCPVLNPAGPTPDLSIAQGYRTATSFFEDMGDEFNTVPSFIAASLLERPTVPLDDDDIDEFLQGLPSSAGFTRPDIYPRFFEPILGWTGEGFDLEGLWQYAEDLNTGVENLTRGKTTRIAVLYPTAFVQPTDGTPSTDNDQTHEDLRGRVLYPEVDQTQIIIPNSPTGFLTGHAGTAFLGIIGANPDNGIGMKGMSPDADLHFFPTVSMEEGGRLVNALTNAIELFEAGDVIIIPYAPRPFNATFASVPTMNLLFSLATDLGISTVIAAGDFRPPAAPIQEQAGEEDSGVIIVGAVTPGLPFYRAGFSSYCSAGSGENCDPLEAVHTAGWGHAVATLGYGDLFMGETDGEPDVLRSYTSKFGGTQASEEDTGTGAAAAQVGAAIANLQGVPKMFYGVPMPPIAIRGEYSGNSFLQAGFGIGSDGPPGTGNDPSWDGDWSLDADPKIVGSMIWPDPQAETNLVSLGVISDLPLAAEWLIIGGYFDNCDELKAVHTIRGEWIHGNLFSICETDGMFYTVRSQQTTVGSSPSFVPPGYEGPMNQVVYRAAGQIADIFVVGQAEPGFVTAYEVSATIGPSTVQQLVGLELYDWQNSRWVLANVIVIPPGTGDIVTTLPGVTFNPQRYFNDDQESLVRVWGFGFGTPPSPGGVPGQITFDFIVDEVDLFIDSFAMDDL